MPVPDADIPKDFDQVAAFCYRLQNAGIEILLIKTDGGRWMFPKGWVEHGEEAWQAAQREALEEAGVTGAINLEALTTFLHYKTDSIQARGELRVAVFPLLVTSIQRPQEKKRRPTWFSPQEAEKALMEDRQTPYADEARRVVRVATAYLRGDD